MTKEFIFTSDCGEEYEVFQHESKPMDCDGCDNKIKKGDFYSMSDAGENYCLDCSS